MKILDNTTNIKNNRSTYPGGKGASGVHQKIINLIPPHITYHELHLGGGSIMKNKLPASLNIGIDIDPKVIKAWSESMGVSLEMLIGSGISELEALSSKTMIRPGIYNNCGTTTSKMSISPEGKNKAAFIFKNEDASSYLKNHLFTCSDFIYADPPYLMETRKGGKIYDFEYDEDDHYKLLKIIKTLPCMVMISGYWSSLYSEILQGWNTHSFQSQTRQGPATEWVWFNYPFPTELHDYSYLGDTFRERERIKKKKDRWVARLLRTPILERNAILKELLEV